MLIGGGYASSNVTTIETLEIAIKSNSVEYGDLTTARQTSGATSNCVRYVAPGGSSTNVIDYVNIQTGGTAADFGDLTVGGGSGATTSNCHGGLG